MMNATLPAASSTGEFTGLQKRSSKPPPCASGRRTSYFCTAIASGAPVATTRTSEARRLLTPVAAGSSGLSGKTSKMPRPTIVVRAVIVAAK
jgi:hypothetical protein